MVFGGGDRCSSLGLIGAGLGIGRASSVLFCFCLALAAGEVAAQGAQRPDLRPETRPHSTTHAASVQSGSRTSFESPCSLNAHACSLFDGARQAAHFEGVGSAAIADQSCPDAKPDCSTNLLCRRAVRVARALAQSNMTQTINCKAATHTVLQDEESGQTVAIDCSALLVHTTFCERYQEGTVFVIARVERGKAIIPEGIRR